MKRINCFVVSIIMVVCGCIFASCTADESYEVGQAASDAKAKELEMKIMSLAEEYGLDVQVGNLVSSGLIDDADALEKIDSIFRSLSTLRGRYNLVRNQNGDKVVMQTKKVRSKYARTRSAAYEWFEYDFDGYEEGDFSCYCSIRYSEDEKGERDNVSVDAGINTSLTPTGDCSNEVNGWVDIRNNIKIGGSVTLYEVMSHSAPGIIVKFHVEGFYDGVDGEIEWS